MSARKRTADEDVEVATASRRPLRLAIIGAVVVAVSVGVGMAVWRHVRGHVLAGSQYRVHADQITISPPPEWIHPDEGSDDASQRIKLEVLRDLERDGPLSLLDKDLTVRLAEAFTAHPWVLRVDRVSKQFPSGVEASLAYRVPVAMVEVATDDGSGVLPVDESGVLLPTRDFTVDEAEQYPRIAEIFTQPPAAVGKRWGDAAVLGGAQIAASLGSDWQHLNLPEIVPVERKPARSGFEYTYALITRSGTRIDWGRAPGTDLPGEVPARDKISQLKVYQQQNGGTLDGPQGAWHIEIDHRGALLQKGRPDIAPLPSSDAPPQATLDAPGSANSR